MSSPEKIKSDQVKKAYHSPVIRHYGAIQAVTEAVGMMSMNADGATMGNRKTA
jgi:hypothetical protein